MMGIAISNRLDPSSLERYFQDEFSDRKVLVVEGCEGDFKEGFNFYIIHNYNTSEFKTILELPIDDEHNLIALATKLSVDLRCRVLTDAFDYAPTEAPYWSLIIDEGVLYLADDMGSDHFDGEGGPIKIVKKL